MPEKGLGLQQKCVVAMVGIDLATESVLDEMPMRRDMELYVSKFVYDAANDRYARVPNERDKVLVFPDQYMGCFSDDGRIEMVSDRASDFFPMMKVGNRVCVCFDSLSEMGCIRSASHGSTEIRYAMSGYFGKYDFDGEPVEPLSNMEMQEMVKRMDVDDEEPEPEQPEAEEAETEAEDEAAAEAEDQPGSYSSGYSSGHDDGMLSQEELDRLLAGMSKDDDKTADKTQGARAASAEAESDGEGHF